MDKQRLLLSIVAIVIARVLYNAAGWSWTASLSSIIGLGSSSHVTIETPSADEVDVTVILCGKSIVHNDPAFNTCLMYCRCKQPNDTIDIAELTGKAGYATEPSQNKTVWQKSEVECNIYVPSNVVRWKLWSILQHHIPDGEFHIVRAPRVPANNDNDNDSIVADSLQDSDFELCPVKQEGVREGGHSQSHECREVACQALCAGYTLIHQACVGSAWMFDLAD